jgi:hypothetical protein
MAIKKCKDQNNREFLTIKISHGFDAKDMAQLIVQYYGESVLKDIENKSYQQLIKTVKWQLLDKGMQCFEYPDDLEWITDANKLIEIVENKLINLSDNKLTKINQKEGK